MTNYITTMLSLREELRKLEYIQDLIEMGLALSNIRADPEKDLQQRGRYLAWEQVNDAKRARIEMKILGMATLN